MVSRPACRLGRRFRAATKSPEVGEGPEVYAALCGFALAEGCRSGRSATDARYDPRVPVDPSNLRIRTYPDPVLRRKAEPIDRVDHNVRDVALRMVELMFQADGIGLAAPQVGLPWRLFVAHVPESEGRSATADPPSATPDPRVYINPEITSPLGPLETAEEGCLSLPDIRGEVLRPQTVTISALDVEGQPFKQTATGLLARCWQHEVDHLDGVLIIDKMPQMSRLKNRSLIRALERQSSDLL